MPIVAKAGKTYTPAPAGTHAAVCVDVIDLGKVETVYQGKSTTAHKIYIVWKIDEVDEQGQSFLVRSRYTLSLHKKARLRKDLESWRGRPFTEAEQKGFDVESVLGVPCMLSLVHNVTEGNTYANVMAIMKLGKGMTAPPIGDYVRVQDRPSDHPGNSQPVPPEDDDGYAASLDDVPF